jgi:hypothetical protein
MYARVISFSEPECDLPTSTTHLLRGPEDDGQAGYQGRKDRVRLEFPRVYDLCGVRGIFCGEVRHSR